LTTEALQILSVNRNSNVFVPAHLLYDFPERGLRTSWDLEIRNSGQFSRRQFQKNFRLRFPAAKPFRGMTILNLSSQPTDDTKLRSVLGYSVLRAAGFHVPALEPVALYLNNSYMGLHYLIEPIDKSFFDRRSVPISSLFEAKLLAARWAYSEGYDVREGYEKLYPDDGNFSELDWLLRTITNARPETLEQQLAPIFDLESYLSYQACMVVIQNFDSWDNNFHLYHDARGGVLRLQPWDVDHAYDTHIGINAPTALSDLIIANRPLHVRYLQHVLSLLNGPGHPDTLQHIIRTEVPRLAPAYDADPYNIASSWTLSFQASILESQVRESHARVRDEVMRRLLEVSGP
jgi:spore coat protein CotH